MESSSPKRVLVVAHKTAATPALIQAVRDRASQSPCSFTLLVPNSAHGLHRVVDPEDQGTGEADQVLEHAIPLLSEAAGSPVEGQLGSSDPLAAIHDAVNMQDFEEIIISTLPARFSKWLKLDIPSKLSGLDLPITTVTSPE